MTSPRLPRSGNCWLFFSFGRDPPPFKVPEMNRFGAISHKVLGTRVAGFLVFTLWPICTMIQLQATETWSPANHWSNVIAWRGQPGNGEVAAVFTSTCCLSGFLHSTPISLISNTPKYCAPKWTDSKNQGSFRYFIRGKVERITLW